MWGDVASGVGDVAVHLRFAESEHVVGGSGMADHAFGSGRKVPILCCESISIDEVCVSGIGVPAVGVSGPFILPANHEACFDWKPGGLIAGFMFEEEAFDEDGAVREVPATW